jgi:Protein of unknown function (DUF1571)
MKKTPFLVRTARLFAISAVTFIAGNAAAQEEAGSGGPVAHQASAKDGAVPAANASAALPAVAPIDRALDIANEGLQFIRSDIRDYTATMVKRERIDGIVGDPEFMAIKVRNRKEQSGVPLSVYMKFLRPASVKDREVIWVEGRDDNKLVAHEGSGLLTMTVRLDPNGFIAMKGQRYPITECGIENLVYRLVEKGEYNKKIGGAQVEFFDDTKINGRKCTMIQLMHPTKRPEAEFYICRIFIDQEMQVPVRYAAYTWPTEEGGKPVLEEEYTYLDVSLNVGLRDLDFDPENPAYRFK